MTMALIKKGDTVMVISGRERGKTGKVLEILTKKERVLVERLNMVKRHLKPTQKDKQGGILEKEASLALSVVFRWGCSVSPDWVGMGCGKPNSETC